MSFIGVTCEHIIRAEAVEVCWCGTFRCVNTIFPENSPQSHTVQCSEKLQNPREFCDSMLQSTEVEK